jgi:dipeptidase E
VTPTILAMGGGGFTMEPDNPALDDFALSLVDARAPKVLFLPTASGDTAAQIQTFHERYDGRVDCSASVLSLFRLHGTTRPVSEIILESDLIYVGGGSMRNLLAIWKAHGLDELLIRAWRGGTVLCGLSAGAMCWFAGGITKSSGPPEPISGLGLLPGSLSVHADGEPERLPAFLAAVKSGRLPGGWAADDGVGLLFRESKLERIVSSRPAATALRVDAVAGELVRCRIQPELLASPARREIPDDILEFREEMRRRR